MQKITQSYTVKEKINRLIDEGETDQNKIYSKIVEELGVPRPTVRRIVRDLKIELMQKINILSGEPEKE